ncbi:hypothetical protein G6W51_16780 [Streptomyces coelicolor]|nr:hypothetical protein [Streptomyces coelicolor]
MPQRKPARANNDVQEAEAPPVVVKVMTALTVLVVVMALFGTDKHSERAFRLLDD